MAKKNRVRFIADTKVGEVEFKTGAEEDFDESVAAELVKQKFAVDVPDAPPAKPGKKTKVRLLVDGAHGQCGAAVELDAEIAAGLIAGGTADGAPAAVKYAESQAKAKE